MAFGSLSPMAMSPAAGMMPQLSPMATPSMGARPDLAKQGMDLLKMISTNNKGQPANNDLMSLLFGKMAGSMGGGGAGGPMGPMGLLAGMFGGGGAQGGAPAAPPTMPDPMTALTGQ